MTLDDTRQILLTQLDALQARADAIATELTKGYSHDSVEQAQERENDEVLTAIQEECRKKMMGIKKALQRIEDHEYGICQSCGQPIGQARLQALPDATLCIRCAEISDR
jgi:DnaK suppressor protein